MLSQHYLTVFPKFSHDVTECLPSPAGLHAVIKAKGGHTKY